MRRIVVSTFVTLDGVMEAPEKWSFDFQGEDDMLAALQLLQSSEALLLGRHTYQAFAGSWPARTDPMGFAEKINSMPKYVVSRTLTDQAASWNPTTVVRDDVPDTLRALKAQPGGDLLMYGSATLMRSLAEHDLIDEYNLLLNPVVVGTGKLLHPAGSFPHKLTLTEATAFSGGIVDLRYRPAGDSGVAPVVA